MDSRAKQRLTGAVILVALFVVLVPELLTGPAKNPAPGATKDDGLHSYTIDIDSPTSSVSPQKTPEPAVALPAPATTKPSDTPTSAFAPPAAASPPPATAAQEVTAPPVSATTAAPEKPAAEKPAAEKPVIEATAPKPAPTPTTRPPPPAKGTFVVQLGSFGSRENAERLVKEMTAKGHPAFLAPIASGGRELFRVRVGPTHDRASAEALAAELRKIGQSGSVVPIS
jgi:DedD protein